MIRVEIVPLPRGRFCAMLGSRVLVATSTDAERAACRALLALGIKGEMVTRWKGADHDAMSFPHIEAAAKFTIVDEATRGLRKVRWRPMPISTEGDPLNIVGIGCGGGSTAASGPTPLPI